MTARRGRPTDQAARERIVTAATGLFVRHGYLSTTVGAIADDAQVAVKTIYAAYGNKLGVLSAAHDHAVLGSAEAAPLLRHTWVLGLADADSAVAAWADAAHHLSESTARAAPIMTVIHHAAADPGVGDLLRELHRQRHAFSLGLARILLALPGVAPDAVTSQVADVLYATMSVESYTLFVAERRWTLERWRDWAHDTVGRELTAPPTPG